MTKPKKSDSIAARAAALRAKNQPKEIARRALELLPRFASACDSYFPRRGLVVHPTPAFPDWPKRVKEIGADRDMHPLNELTNSLPKPKTGAEAKWKREFIKINDAVCDLWVRKYWEPVAVLIRVTLYAETFAELRALVPKDEYHAELHPIVVEFIHKLNFKRAIEDVTELRFGLDDHRFKLRGYFEWLAREVKRLSGPRVQLSAVSFGIGSGVISDPKPPANTLAPKPREPAIWDGLVLPKWDERDREFLLIFIEQPPGLCLTSTRLCELFGNRATGLSVPADSAFRTRIVPRLLAWGLQNEGKRGYSLPADALARRVFSAGG